MRKITVVYFIIIITGFLTGCGKEDFLERPRLTAVSPENFFTNANDFKLYVNQFYNDLGNAKEWDIWVYGYENGTDNLIGFNPNNDLNGLFAIPTTEANWTNAYARIRGINIMLTNTGRAKWDDIKPYVAEIKFFRALQYYNLLKRYGGVPWINKLLNTFQEDQLKAPRLSRNVLADSIISDLDFAIANLPTHQSAEKLRISKEVALAFKSRICLYEGTWEKYHGKAGSPFAVPGSDGTKFLQMAVDAAQQVINSGVFAIDKTGAEPYYNFFNKEDYSASKEVILWRKVDKNSSPRSLSRSIWLASHQTGLTKDLIDAYLCTDGKPISLTSLEVSDDSLPGVITNRDPRLAQTIFYPGIPFVVNDRTGDAKETFKFTNLSEVRTGYQYRKGGSVLESRLNANGDAASLIYIRFAEVLLNYIEAKAELNESGQASLTQNDFDISINAIRDRVNMTHFKFSETITDTNDPLTGQVPWYIVEIRRERRVELALEGFRKDDIFRWAAADKYLMGKIFNGAKYQWFVDREYYQQSSVTAVDNKGYLSPWINTEFDKNGGYLFKLGRDYLYPVPTQEMLLGDYSNNNPGWD